MTPDLDRLEALAKRIGTYSKDHNLPPEMQGPSGIGMDEWIYEIYDITARLRTRLAALEQSGVTEALRAMLAHYGPPEAVAHLSTYPAGHPITMARAALAPAPIVQGGERYRHVKRGTEYEVIGTAELQIATGDLVDGSVLVVYRGDDGKVWAREEDEFHDGRFVALQPPAGAA